VEKKLILRGLLAGAFGGLLAFVFARIFAEPLIQRAIDYEDGRGAAEAALQRAGGGMAMPADGGELISRSVQSNVGIGVGLIGFGLVMGALYAVAYALCLGRTGRVRPRPLALLVALAGFVVVFLVPFLKYPANPPAIGHEETIRDRASLYLLMLAISLVAAVVAVVVGQALKARLGTWNASVAAAVGFAAVVGVAMAILPNVGHLASNLANYGRHATETPLPLRDDAGAIVFPGFPADVLAEFRLYAVGAQLVLWAAIGLAFAPMAEKVLAPAPRPAAPAPAPQPVAS
jgi:hypothetical protein